MSKRAPSKDEWVSLRVEIEQWYLKKHRTASWIVAELGKRDLLVTRKMLYYRLREWQVPRKYQPPKRGHLIDDGATTNYLDTISTSDLMALSTPETLGSRQTQKTMPVRPLEASMVNRSRPLNASGKDYLLCEALASIGNYYDNLCETGLWRSITASRAAEMQRLVANAHMTVSSQTYDVRATWVELLTLEKNVRHVMISYCHETIHPRVLTALLRLLVSSWSASQWESETLKVVMGMFRTVSALLPYNHPVHQLCRLSDDGVQPEALLNGFLNQAQAKLYDRIGDLDPDFVAREQIYSARVLASLGRATQADALLFSILSKYADRADGHTLADCYRTFGFSRLYADQLDDAEIALDKALLIFTTIGETTSENVMFTHHSLATVYRKKADFSKSEFHCEAALQVWESNTASHERQGGIKFVRDLYQIYEVQNKMLAMDVLRERYSEYFEESPEHSPD